MENLLFLKLFNIYNYLLALVYSDYTYFVLFSVVVFLISFSGRADKLIKYITVGISAGLVGVDAGIRILDRYNQNKKAQGTSKDKTSGSGSPSPLPPSASAYRRRRLPGCSQLLAGRLPPPDGSRRAGSRRAGAGRGKALLKKFIL